MMWTRQSHDWKAYSARYFSFRTSIRCSSASFHTPFAALAQPMFQLKSSSVWK